MGATSIVYKDIQHTQFQKNRFTANLKKSAGVTTEKPYTTDSDMFLKI